jgi:phospholipase C
MREDVTRRQLLRAGLGGAAAVYGLDRLGQLGGGLSAALAAPPRFGRLSDIEHVVIFVQENRSFDHYFGAYRGVRGFADPRVLRAGDGSGLPVFAQPGYPSPSHDGRLYPFHLDASMNGECTHDINHDWAPQHRCWNDGRMNRFVHEHLAVDGPDYGTLTMGYYKRSDLEYYYALADAFTICDHYHCSAIGPTDPNQLYLFSATLDPAGKKGGPIVETFGSDRPSHYGSVTWTTMPEQLREKGISWKCYSGDSFTNTEDPPMAFFSQYFTDPELFANGLTPTFPAGFMDDVQSGNLPQVSWIWDTIVKSEHPPAPPIFGENSTDMILQALTADPELWRKTALFITWDENGGFFDHVPPPVPPPGTKGEKLTVANLPAAAEGIREPIGLGFRVPALVVSPFSRGGFVCSDVFDHTSLLRFLERRFGAEVPNLSEWRRSTTGDLTSAFNFADPRQSVPALPATSLTDPRVVASDCPVGPLGLTGAPVPPYPVPSNAMPRQEKGKPRRPSGIVRRCRRRHHHRHHRHHHHRHHRRCRRRHQAP